MPVVPDRYLLTTTEEEMRQRVWASTFGYVHWCVMHSNPHSSLGGVGKKRLQEHATRKAVRGADEAVAAYEEHIQDCRKQEYERR